MNDFQAMETLRTILTLLLAISYTMLFLSLGSLVLRLSLRWYWSRYGNQPQVVFAWYPLKVTSDGFNTKGKRIWLRHVIRQYSINPYPRGVLYFDDPDEYLSHYILYLNFGLGESHLDYYRTRAEALHPAKVMRAYLYLKGQKMFHDLKFGKTLEGVDMESLYANTPDQMRKIFGTSTRRWLPPGHLNYQRILNEEEKLWNLKK